MSFTLPIDTYTKPTKAICPQKSFKFTKNRTPNIYGHKGNLIEVDMQWAKFQYSPKNNAQQPISIIQNLQSWKQTR